VLIKQQAKEQKPKQENNIPSISSISSDLNEDLKEEKTRWKNVMVGLSNLPNDPQINK
jgi:hypothetical protein